jgi:predicted RNA binding protein YcfA (HicA-like mRNA interferase family)
MSEVDRPRLRPTTACEIISALNRDRFSLRNRSASHQRYRRPDAGA